MAANELLEQINEDLAQSVILLSKMCNDKLIETSSDKDLVKYFIKLKETIEIAKSKLEERIERIIFNINLLNKKIKKHKPLNTKDTFLSDYNIKEYVFNTIEVNNYVHHILNDKNILTDKSELKELHSKFWIKHLEFKEKIYEYNKEFPNNKLLTLEEAKELNDKEIDKSVVLI